MSETERAQPTVVVRCPRCRSPIPEGTIWCPGCRLELAFCEECATPLAIEEPACPSCGAPNPVRRGAANEAGGAAAPDDAGRAVPHGQAENQPTAGPAPHRDDGTAPGPAAAGSVAPEKGGEPPYDPPAHGAGAGESELSTAEALRLLLEKYGQPREPCVLERPGAPAVSPPPAVTPPRDAVTTPGPPPDQREPSDSSFVFLGVEIETARYEAGKNCVIHLRVMGRRPHGTGQLELWAESPWWDAPIGLSSPLAVGTAGVHHHLPFVPQGAGEVVLTLTATLRDDRGVPLDRRVGNRLLAVEPPPPPPAASIHAEKGSTIFLDGKIRDILDPLERPGVPRGSWEPVDMRADPWFQVRQPRFRPEPRYEAPPRLRANRLWPRDRPLSACLRWSDPRKPVSWVASVVVGTTCRLGRGEDAEVAWWLSPVPYSEKQHRRLSAAHAGLRIRHGLGACPNICSCSRMAAGFRWALAFSASAQPCARTIPLNLPRRCRSGARSSKDCGSSRSVATRPTLSPGLATETCGSLART